MSFLLDWRVIAGAQAYWPTFFLSEAFFKDMVAAVIISVVLVLLVWTCIWAQRHVGRRLQHE